MSSILLLLVNSASRREDALVHGRACCHNIYLAMREVSSYAPHSAEPILSCPADGIFSDHQYLFDVMPLEHLCHVLATFTPHLAKKL